MEKADVVIIGAGISGLCAAKLLHEEGLEVIVLEARDRVGGRSFTARDPSYDYVDLGAGYVGPTQDRILRLAKELKVKTVKTDENGKVVFNLKNNWSTAPSGVFPDIYNPFILMDLNNTFRTIDAFAKQVPLEAPWDAPRAVEWDSMTFAQFTEKVCWTRFVQDILIPDVQSIVGAEQHEVSLLFFLWFIQSGGSFGHHSDLAQERKFIGGSMQISEKMAEILGSRVKLSSPVVKIDQRGERAIITTDQGRHYQVSHVISSVPVSLLNKILFQPALPVEKLQLIQRFPMGCVIKTVMFYDKEYWKDQGLAGTAISTDGPVAFCLNDTKPDGSHPAIMGFILANQSKHYTSLSKYERKRNLADFYAKVFKIDELRHPIGYEEMNWMNEEYSGGCYTGVMPPGVLTSFGRMLREPVGNVHFAGTETASKWVGYMDGAVQAGERAAREILHKLGRISLEEVWQEEKPSEDVPHLPMTEMAIEKFLPSVETNVKFWTILFIAVFLWIFFKYFEITFRGM